MKVSRVIEAKSVTNVYMGWRNELQLTVEGGQLNIKEKAEEARKLAAEPEEAESETVQEIPFVSGGAL